ncbi:MAG: hemerythrin domain-containing protein [Candidatus Eremiobacteraeota bacterium]|nr:hemerythrin domain-containing protein [Candidatus Eremiobacteraeota bacterium]
MPYGLARDIQTCRGHHAVLRAQLERFPAPVAANAPQIRAALRDLQTVLVRHLAFEDVRLYPVLEAAEPAVAERARRYREEMGDLSVRVVAFFERWTAQRAIEAEPDAFARAWDAVSTALERRMAAEDDDLYEIAEKHPG